ncbi:hypothetical protein F5144DRAFT_243929 [Chaetomium tenue]|uniref:Uncharacterized protein n=1 Tax=Chaetomium tenue TaxID=1854479 RepID=A0ACB7P754_9PEZI|nr:hypothetical protein F5144DRAFT_243929 [Chaetomium globosum]
MLLKFMLMRIDRSNISFSQVRGAGEGGWYLPCPRPSPCGHFFCGEGGQGSLTPLPRVGRAQNPKEWEKQRGSSYGIKACEVKRMRSSPPRPYPRVAPLVSRDVSFSPPARGTWPRYDKQQLSPELAALLPCSSMVASSVQRIIGLSSTSSAYTPQITSFCSRTGQPRMNPGVGATVGGFSGSKFPARLRLGSAHNSSCLTWSQEAERGGFVEMRNGRK